MTFATALGAMVMKFTASRALRLFGFRRTLIANALISGLFIASYALFTPTTPHWAIFLALLFGGFFRSLEFTALNALSYADIDPPRMSRATSFASVAQQMSGAIGVAVAAVCIQLIQIYFGDAALEARDLSLSFVAIAALSTLSMLVFVRLKPDAARRSPRGRRERRRSRRRRPNGRAARLAADRRRQASRSVAARSDAIRSCAAVEAAMTAGSLPSTPGTPIGQTRVASIESERPASRIWRRNRARLVCEPMTPT